MTPRPPEAGERGERTSRRARPDAAVPSAPGARAGVPPYIDRAVRKRIREAAPQRAAVLRAVAEGRPLDAEPDRARTARRIARLVGVSVDVAEALLRGEKRLQPGLSPGQKWSAKVLLGDTTDFLSIGFFKQALKAADAVGCVLIADQGEDGTCFMISPELLVTNHHVIPDAATARARSVRFDAEIRRDGKPASPTRFALNPDPAKGGFFVASRKNDLDYAVIALGTRTAGDLEPADLGFCPLIARNDKHKLGDFVNIIQHPEGRPKSIVVRENRLVSRPEPSERVLHYLADTERKSSGSPVFNDQWEVVAVHHHGVAIGIAPCPGAPRVPTGANEGIRVSAIVADLVARKDELPDAARRMLRRALGTQMDGPVDPG